MTSGRRRYFADACLVCQISDVLGISKCQFFPETLTPEKLVWILFSRQECELSQLCQSRGLLLNSFERVLSEWSVSYRTDATVKCFIEKLVASNFLITSMLLLVKFRGKHLDVKVTYLFDCKGNHQPVMSEYFHFHNVRNHYLTPIHVEFLDEKNVPKAVVSKGPCLLPIMSGCQYNRGALPPESYVRKSSLLSQDSIRFHSYCSSPDATMFSPNDLAVKYPEEEPLVAQRYLRPRNTLRQESSDKCIKAKICLVGLCLITVIFQCATASLLLLKYVDVSRQGSLESLVDDHKVPLITPKSAQPKGKYGADLIVFGNSSDVYASLETQSLSTLSSFTWRGNIDPKVLYEVLQEASHLETLILDNTDQNDLTEKKSIKPGVLRQIISSLVIDRLVEIKIENSQIDNNAAEYLENIVVSNRESIKTMHFEDSPISMTSLTNGLRAFPNLIDLTISTPPENVLTIDENLSKIFPNLQRFALDSGKIEYNSIPDLFELVCLEELHFTCLVPREIAFVDLRIFRNAPKSLESAEIYFEFEAKSFGQTCGLESAHDEGRKVKLTTYSNC